MNVTVTRTGSQVVTVVLKDPQLVPAIIAQPAQLKASPSVSVGPRPFRASPMIAFSLLSIPQISMIGLPGPQGPPGPPGPASDQIYVSDTPPSSPEINDLWVDLS